MAGIIFSENSMQNASNTHNTFFIPITLSFPILLPRLSSRPAQNIFAETGKP